MKKSILISAGLCLSLLTRAQNEVACPFTNINSDITTNTTLSAGTLYRLQGCIHVTSGVTLTIPAGTVIMGEKSSVAGLVIDKGAYLLAQGNVNNPILFISDQKPGWRNPGDFAGIVINGEATNNAPGNILQMNRTCIIDAGGTDDNDSSGILQYIRIEHSRHGLTLASVGRNTIIDHIQVSYPEFSAFEFWGGTAQAKNLFAYNAKANDFEFNFGNRSKVREAVAFRLDPAAYSGTAPYANGILIANTNDASNNYLDIPYTRPVLDKFSLFGPAYCGDTSINTHFKNALFAYRNARFGLYHSIISGWPTGLLLDDAQTLSNASTITPVPFLFVAANSFEKNLLNDYDHTAAWPSSCASDMTSWITGSGPCAQQYNEFSAGSTGYDGSLCAQLCSADAPSFIMSGSELDDTYYTSINDLDNDPFFTASDHRGAFDATTDWTESWTAFCPSDNLYCSAGSRNLSRTSIDIKAGSRQDHMLIYPNPSNTLSYAEFSVQESGTVSLRITNSMGQLVHSSTIQAIAGKQKVPLHMEGLSAGVYFIHIGTGKDQALQGSVIIK